MPCKAMSPRPRPLAAANRRAWLRGPLALLGGFALWPLARGREVAGPARVQGQAATTTLLGKRSYMRQVGALYLAAHPQEADRNKLRHWLFGAGAEPAEMSLIGRMADDWRTQDIVVISGWVFARTEARLCAYLHLGGVA